MMAYYTLYSMRKGKMTIPCTDEVKRAIVVAGWREPGKLRCTTSGVDGLVCTRRLGHSGPHIALTSTAVGIENARLCAMWARDTDAVLLSLRVHAELQRKKLQFLAGQNIFFSKLKGGK